MGGVSFIREVISGHFNKEGKRSLTEILPRMLQEDVTGDMSGVNSSSFQ